MTDRVADRVVFLVVLAEIVTDLVLVTVLVETVKVAVVFPAATVTLEGTVATEVELLERFTTVPADGAGPESVTVPVDGDPPLTVVGFNATEAGVGGVTVKDAVLVAP